jgi:dihydrodipicolinate synthase/N-acetylneuraminate lyase
MNLAGLRAGGVRLPLTEPSSETRKALEEVHSAMRDMAEAA